MAEYKHISVSCINDVCNVMLLNNRIVDEIEIKTLGEELFSLVEKEGYTKILLNFTNVQFLSSAALSKLIMLYKKIAVRKGVLKLCCLSNDIRELFDIMNLHKLFDIKETGADALAAF